MTFRRSGTCNMCGECCGQPTPSGWQNNPWPKDLVESTKSWDTEYRKQQIPIFAIAEEGKSGSHVVGNHTANWCWISDGSFGSIIDGVEDIRCPFLMNANDGTHPCAIYGSQEIIPGTESTYHEMWTSLCSNPPPETFELEDLEQWQSRCPSCSFVFTEE